MSARMIVCLTISERNETIDHLTKKWEAGAKGMGSGKGLAPPPLPHPTHTHTVSGEEYHTCDRKALSKGFSIKYVCSYHLTRSLPTPEHKHTLLRVLQGRSGTLLTISQGPSTPKHVHILMGEGYVTYHLTRSCHTQTHAHTVMGEGYCTYHKVPPHPNTCTH